MSREAAGWLYVRLSGIALLFLVLGHVFFMHLLIGVNRIDFALVAARWSGLGWRSYDLVMLLLAMPHAALGLRSLAFDHMRGRARRPFVGAGYAACAIVAALGSWVILTFPQGI